MGESISNAKVGCFFIRSHSSSVNLSGLSRILSGTPSLPISCSNAPCRICISISPEKSGEMLMHIRHGALLHDIGKLGVPDNILLKPDKLTDEEWLLMKKHPTFAFEMLAPIQYLNRAMNIPYCHHEKWDGTGYPRGLSGEQIPLEARIFAVVDVWDAITSDRPYRKAWTNEKAMEHIRSLAGTHFDPRIAERFLELKQEET